MLNPIPLGGKKSGVYQTVNRVNHKVYVGSALNLRSRCHAHVERLNARKHVNPHLQHAWDLHGPGAFTFQVLEYVDQDTLTTTEQYWLDTQMELGEVYNLCPTAGSRLGSTQSEACRQKVSQASRGKVVSDETKARMGEASRQRWQDPEYREKTLASMAEAKAKPEYHEKLTANMMGNQRSRGVTRSPETRALMSAAATGRVASPETLAKLSKSHKGLPVSDETREKHRARMTGNQNRLGQTASEETRTKMAEAHQGNQNARGPHRKFSEETKARMRAAWARRKAAKEHEAANEKP